MRTETTNYNASAYALATSFQDRKNGVVMTIPANEAEKVRSMNLAIAGGDYIAGPDSLVALPALATLAALATQVVTVTVLNGVVPQVGARVFAVSSDVTKGTVSVASALTNGSGEASFTVTAVATGSATVTFSAGALSDTFVLTVS